MNFENTFTVPIAPAEVFKAMMDFERVAPCMPGAEVTERIGDDAYKVQVRVKVGPMSMVYRGEAEIADRDEEALSAAMRVKAREARGQGTANATVQINLAQEGDGTRATMATDLKLSGRAAAMGRGVITDVSHALVSEFADNLARMLSSEDGSNGPEGAPAPPRPEGAPAPPPRPEVPPPPPNPQAAPPPPPADALDAGQLARSVVAGRLGALGKALPVAGLLALAALVLGFRLGRRSRRR